MIDSLQLALLRGDASNARRLVAAELVGRRTLASRRTQLVGAQAFASILDSEFARACEEASLAKPTTSQGDLLIAALRTLASAMGGLERDGPDIASVEQACSTIVALSETELRTSIWAAALTGEAAMAVGRLDLAETIARRTWLAAAQGDQPDGVFAGQTLARAMLFQGKLNEAEQTQASVDVAAERHDLAALRLVLRGSLAYVEALRDRRAEVLLHVR